jgi:hypothetical protein
VSHGLAVRMWVIILERPARWPSTKLPRRGEVSSHRLGGAQMRPSFF